MSMKTEMPRHLEDHELVGLMDQVGPEADRVDWEVHVAGCVPCAERLEELRAGSSWLRQNVVLLDQDVHVDELAKARAMAAARQAARQQAKTFSWAGVGRAAAVVGLIGAIGLTPNPVRAWFLDWTGLGAEEVVEAPAPLAETARGAMVTFAPTERLFTIELAQPQTEGTVQITLSADDAATAQLLNGGNESFSVLPNALLVDNPAGSRGSYEIHLPGDMVRTVHLVVAGERIAEIPVSADMAPVILDLAPGGAP